jgi:hypothetical protein
MIGLHENIFLKFSAFNLIVVKDDIFSKRFHGIHFFGIFLFYEKDFTETAAADDFTNDEILEGDLAISLLSIQSTGSISETVLGIIILTKLVTTDAGRYRRDSA